ncbi:HI1506-related protein [Pseudoalteromonas sp. CnMc7-15]|uniref:HI1506-related protein n=1 Tax=unclassified Pseudoalteromonas TaxID=194690 RepID=UPI001EF6D486|nr:HI1506-related protein [Pseudoalteromonas sp. CnMc7-15]MCG7565858.1 HI1506-related protein [Pseudoalteromonas sp. CnMc7-15]
MSKETQSDGPAGLVVINPRDQVYRRCGFKFAPGKNTFDASAFTDEQIEALGQDPHITVQDKKASQSAVSKSHVDLPNLGELVELDTVDDALKPIVAIMVEKAFDKKPNVDQVAFTAPGEHDGDEPKTVKPSAAQRDEAWQIIVDAVAAANGGA